MGKQVVKFLVLPNPELYTGHSFRRTSETLLVDSGALKSHGGWKSTLVAKGNIAEYIILAKTLYYKLWKVPSKKNCTETNRWRSNFCIQEFVNVTVWRYKNEPYMAILE